MPGKRLLVLSMSAALGLMTGCSSSRCSTCSTCERPSFFQRMFRRDNCCDVPPGCCDGPMLGDPGMMTVMPPANGGGMAPMAPMAPQATMPNLTPPPGTRIVPQPQPQPLAPMPPQSQPQSWLPRRFGSQ